MPEVQQAILGSRKAVATIAVKNMEVARKFYHEVLGLEPAASSEPGAQTFASADTLVLVYVSQFAATNQATAATWLIDAHAEEGIESVVAALRDKGVRFEHYDFPGGVREGDVHVMGRIKNAWFKDPDGNVLSIVSES
jgi:catechol 2,3-dioxygenase-like lactoylglutathione lyase family enzyme